MVTSTILCHCVHTSSVVTSTYMIPCSIVRLCSGVLYSLNNITSTHLSHAFSYSPVCAGVIGVSVSSGIVTIAVVGGGTAVIVVVIKWRSKKNKEVCRRQ